MGTAALKPVIVVDSDQICIERCWGSRASWSALSALSPTLRNAFREESAEPQKVDANYLARVTGMRLYLVADAGRGIPMTRKQSCYQSADGFDRAYRYARVREVGTVALLCHARSESLPGGSHVRSRQVPLRVDYDAPIRCPKLQSRSQGISCTATVEVN